MLVQLRVPTGERITCSKIVETSDNKLLVENIKIALENEEKIIGR